MKGSVSHSPHRPGAWLDRLGVSASLACAAHCAALTIALAFWPALWLRQEIAGVEVRWLLWAEWVLAIASLLLAGAAAWRGWRSHRRWPPVLGLAAGALLLVLGVFTRLHFVPIWGTVLVVCGGACLVAGHWMNLRHAGPHVHQ
jgi:hypothetical protein